MCGARACKVSVLLPPSCLTRLVAPLAAVKSCIAEGLQHLDFNGIGLFGTCEFVLGELNKITTLTYLDLYRNNIEGQIPSQSLHALPNLRVFNMACNNTFGPIPDLRPMRRLYLLNLNCNFLSGCIPDTLGSVSSLRELWLSHNSLQGPLTPSIGGLRHLTTLVLGHNYLTGVLPNSLSKLQKLRVLYLQENRFRGPIPAGLLELGSSLISLSLRDNRLTGSIPSDISRLSSLDRLHLGSNALSGEIPGTIGQIASLRHLFLSSNDLSGQVPTGDLARPSNIITVDLRDNPRLLSRGRASRRISLAIRRRRPRRSGGGINVKVLMINPIAEYSDDAEDWRV